MTVTLVRDGFSETDGVRLVRDRLRDRVRLLADLARTAADDASDIKSEIDRHVRALVVVGQLLPARRKEVP